MVPEQILKDGCIGVSYRKSIRCRKDSIFTSGGKETVEHVLGVTQIVLLLKMKCGRRSGRGDDPSGSGSALPGCLLQTPIRLAFPSLLSLGPATAFLVTHPLPPWARPVDLRRFPLCLTCYSGLTPGHTWPAVGPCLCLTGHLPQPEQDTLSGRSFLCLVSSGLRFCHLSYLLKFLSPKPPYLHSFLYTITVLCMHSFFFFSGIMKYNLGPKSQTDLGSKCVWALY